MFKYRKSILRINHVYLLFYKTNAIFPLKSVIGNVEYCNWVTVIDRSTYIEQNHLAGHRCKSRNGLGSTIFQDSKHHTDIIFNSFKVKWFTNQEKHKFMARYIADSILNDREFSLYFGNMTHTREIGNFSGVLLRIGKTYKTQILQ